jgi:predicted DNA-binding transcriptional regulator YafY
MRSMNRIERLTAILLLLQDRPHSSSEIARHFEVSKRTILRDVQALSEMGVPVIAQEGARGGYSLPERYVLDPPALSAQESFLMLLALRALSGLADAPFGAARASLVAKMRRVLSREQMTMVDRWLNAVEVDMPRRGPRSPFLDRLIAAAQAGEWVLAEYASRERVSRQHLLPLKVTAERGLWYCQAWSAERGEARRYRVDRFQAVGPVEASFRPPPAGRAPAYDDPSHPEVRATLTARGVALGEAELEQVGPLARQPDGGAALRFRCPPGELDYYARFFAGLGEEAQVDAPEALRERLGRMGRGLVQRYSR